MITGLLFSEFDIHKGPIVSMSYPEHMDKQIKETLVQEVEFFKDIIIPTTEICFKSCILEFEDHNIIGFPIELKDERYERIKLVYNCLLVISKDCEGKEQVKLFQQYFIEKACEKLAIYLMEFEQKYHIISNMGKREILHSILSNVFTNLQLNKKTAIRLMEDVICLDVISNFQVGSMEVWKRHNRFKVPVMM